LKAVDTSWPVFHATWVNPSEAEFLLSNKRLIYMEFIFHKN